MSNYRYGERVVDEKCAFVQAHDDDSGFKIFSAENDAPNHTPLCLASQYGENAKSLTKVTKVLHRCAYLVGIHPKSRILVSVFTSTTCSCAKSLNFITLSMQKYCARHY